MEVINVQKLYKSFGDNEVLRGIDFSVHEGELVGLLGENGAGKSTLFSILSGVNKPTKSSVSVCGKDPRNPSSRFNIGVTPQGTGLEQRAKVEKFMYFVADHFGTRADLPHIMQEFKIEKFAKSTIGNLSGGQQRLVAVACAFLAKAPLTLLDEPTTGLDVSIRSEIWNIIRNRRTEGAVIITSHYIEEIQELCDRVLILHNGKIIADAPTAQLSTMSSRSVIELTGVSEPNTQKLLEQFTESEKQDSTLTIYSDNVKSDLEKLYAAGWPFEEIYIKAPSLEESFIQMIGGKEA